MNKKLKEALIILSFFSLGVLVIVWFYHNMAEQDRKDFWDALKRANYFWVFASIFIVTLAHFIRALRWRLIIEPFGFKPRRLNLFFAVMNMYFANSFIPRLGEVTRCAILKRYEGIPIEKSLGTVVAERAIDLLTFLFLLGALAVFEMEAFNQAFESIQFEFAKKNKDAGEPGFLAKNLKFILPGVLVLVFSMLFLLRKNRVFGKIYNKIINLIKGFWQGLKSAFLIKKKGLFIFYTLLIWVLYYCMTFVCFFSLPETVTYDPLVPLAVLLFGSFAIMLIPNGIGVFPVVVSIILMLPKFGGINPGIGTALGWIIWGAQTLMILSVGTLSMILMPIYNNRRA